MMARNFQPKPYCPSCGAPAAFQLSYRVDRGITRSIDGSFVCEHVARCSLDRRSEVAEVYVDHKTGFATMMLGDWNARWFSNPYAVRANFDERARRDLDTVHMKGPIDGLKDQVRPFEEERGAFDALNDYFGKYTMGRRGGGYE